MRLCVAFSRLVRRGGQTVSSDLGTRNTTIFNFFLDLAMEARGKKGRKFNLDLTIDYLVRSSFRAGGGLASFWLSLMIL
jgi:hypothetical protein